MLTDNILHLTLSNESCWMTKVAFPLGKMSNNFLHFALKVIMKIKMTCVCTLTHHHHRVRYPVACLGGTLASQIAFQEGGWGWWVSRKWLVSIWAQVQSWVFLPAWYPRTREDTGCFLCTQLCCATAFCWVVLLLFAAASRWSPGWSWTCGPLISACNVLFSWALYSFKKCFPNPCCPCF